MGNFSAKTEGYLNDGRPKDYSLASGTVIIIVPGALKVQ